MILIRKIILLSAVLVAILAPAVNVFAQEESVEPNSKTYTLLQPLPGMTDTSLDVTEGGGGFKKYMTAIYKLMLALAGILAVLMLVYAGIMYVVSAGNAGMIEKAKSRIWAAIGGLILAVSAYLILFTINPNLVNLDLGIQPVIIKSLPLTQKPPEYKWIGMGSTVRCQTIYMGENSSSRYPSVVISLPYTECRDRIGLPPTNEDGQINMSKWQCCGINPNTNNFGSLVTCTYEKIENSEKTYTVPNYDCSECLETISDLSGLLRRSAVPIYKKTGCYMNQKQPL